MLLSPDQINALGLKQYCPPLFITNRLSGLVIVQRPVVYFMVVNTLFSMPTCHNAMNFLPLQTLAYILTLIKLLALTGLVAGLDRKFLVDSAFEDSHFSILVKILSLKRLALGATLCLWLIPVGCVWRDSHMIFTYIPLNDEETRLYVKLRDKDIPTLPDFPHTIVSIEFTRDSGTDKRLCAIAQTMLTNLNCVDCSDSPKVTDNGVDCLSGITSLRWLYLDHSAVTDHACDIIATKMRLTRCSLVCCANITLQGLLTLAKSETLIEMGFSRQRLTQSQMMQVIESCRRVNRIDIYLLDSEGGTLDTVPLQREASVKKVALFIWKNGRAVQ